jgi:hypothetical protein
MATFLPQLPFRGACVRRRKEFDIVRSISTPNSPAGPDPPDPPESEAHSFWRTSLVGRSIRAA